jgi:hypothetical protein
VVAVRVLDRRGSGTTSGVIAGVDYVAQFGQAGDVANMSLGGGVSTTLDTAVVNASGKSGSRLQPAMRATTRTTIRRPAQTAPISTRSRPSLSVTSGRATRISAIRRSNMALRVRPSNRPG